jgi:DNA-binding transcriptional LysR family regulator
MDTLLSMRAFAKVVECKNFTQAARQLKLSTATVTKHIQSLEQRIGTRLINRNARQFSVTEPGALYYERCLVLLNEIDEVETAVASYGRQPRGHLRISAPMYFGTAELRPIVQAFMRSYSDISVEIHVTNRYVDLIGEDFDLSVRVVSRPLEPSLIERKLATSRLLVCASPDYLRRHGTPRQPRDLLQHRCLQSTLRRTSEGWPFTRDGKTEHVVVAGALLSNHNELLCQETIEGSGISIQPSFNAWRALAAGQLRTVLDDWFVAEVGISVLFPSRKLLPTKTRLFIDFLTAQFPKGPRHDVWLHRAHADGKLPHLAPMPL